MSLKRLTGSLFASDDATSREGQTEEATLPQQSGVNNVYQQGTSGGQGSIFTPAGPDVGLEAALKPL
ncbi:MAG: hypothetical protein IVW55_09810, partial [Chloroflexi bacterium]|nr:hypothetical protein [Chloroflexota bacterium]